MKKIFKYLLLSIALIGIVSACDILNPVIEPADIGLGIKVFFPTKVVKGQPMTINGSGFKDVTEIEFPDGVRVTDFEIVSNDMIRVTAPAGIAAEGGKIIVRTAEDQAESPLPLTLGKTLVSGFSKQEGEKIKVGELLTIFGTDLEFINGIELLDADGNPFVLTDKAFYRKGTSSIMVKIPRNVLLDSSFAGKLYTYDGQEIALPNMTYEKNVEEGHWETKKTIIWENDPAGAEINWSSSYRFAEESHSTGEEIATIPADVWEKMKSETFYLTLTSDNPQVRVTTGWWSVSLTDGDIQPGNALLTDNEDGTWTVEVNLSSNADLLALLDEQHLLFTGVGYTPLEIYFAEEVWIEGGGHMETVKTPIWENDPAGAEINWSSSYRFAGEGFGTGEEIAVIPTDVWEKMKSETFYLTLKSDNPQVRVTTGWWSVSLTEGDIQPGNELLTDNEDGTWTVEVNLSENADLLALLDEQHLLFTGVGYTPIEIYFAEEVWVGGDAGPEEVIIWENDPAGAEINWSSTYRFAGEGFSTGEEIATIPADVWEKMKSETFYLTLTSSNPQVRVTTGWWSISLTDGDIQPGSELLTDNEDGTWTVEVNLSDNADLLALLDEQHLLFTGVGYTPLKIFFLE